jgi:outer membrane protein TolC
MPLGNNEAKARYQRRRIEMRQLTNQLRTTLDTLLLEVQVAVREVNISYREVVAKQQSVRASEADLAAKRDRMALAGDSGAAGSVRLDELLDAQLRLALANVELLGSVVNYNVALANLDRAMGVLLQARQIQYQRQEDENQLPSLKLQTARSNAAP